MDSIDTYNIYIYCLSFLLRFIKYFSKNLHFQFIFEKILDIFYIGFIILSLIFITMTTEIATVWSVNCLHK